MEIEVTRQAFHTENDSSMGSDPMEGSERCQEWLENRER